MNELLRAARAVYDAHPQGRGGAARADLLRRIRADEGLLDAALEHVAESLLHDVERSVRAQTLGGPPPKTFPRELQDRVVRRNRTLFLMDLPVPLRKGSVRLGHATREQLQEAVAVYQAQIDGNTARKNFLLAVAKKVKGQMLVEQAWTEQALVRLKNKVEKEDAA